MQKDSSPSLETGTAVAPPALLDLSVVIVNYNVREFLEQALRSVERAARDLDAEVFVVDNNSVDGSVEMVRRHFPDVHLIANEENVGFSRANNQAIRQARGRYVLVLNPDTIVQEDTFTTLVGFMDAHPEAGAVGCKILNPDGSFAWESRRAFPTPRVAFYRMTGLSRLFPRSRTFGRYNLTYLPPDEHAEVDALSGSCMLVRRGALFSEANTNGQSGHPVRNPTRAQSATDASKSEIRKGAGLLDEDFFMYGEDLDWCYRIQQAGWKIFYTPETQIIHYKGESTKQGELRYVRLFYGAMLRFTEKHFEGRYSRAFAWLLRGGIVARAGLTVLARALRRLAAPLLDFLLVFGVVALLGALRTMQTGVEFAPLFYTLVAPGYALGTVAGIGLTGGYRRSRRHRLRPVWAGALLGLLLAAAAAFFVKEIAFSRVVVGVSFVVSGLLLSAWRLTRRVRHTEPRRALLVGHAEEAHRLQGILERHPRTPFELVGYVSSEAPCAEDTAAGLPCLGTLRHLRDLVRLRRIDDVVFATDGLSHRTLFRLIQQLRDLEVQFKILAEGREHVIGKAAIHDLSMPTLIEAEEALGELRSPATRRAFELSLSLPALALHPLVWLLGRLGGSGSFFERLGRRTQQMGAVVQGRRALVGYDERGTYRPPSEWGLKPGVFAISEGLDAPPNRACWFYVRNQSAALDGSILWRALREDDD